MLQLAQGCSGVSGRRLVRCVSWKGKGMGSWFDGDSKERGSRTLGRCKWQGGDGEANGPARGPPREERQGEETDAV